MCLIRKRFRTLNIDGKNVKLQIVKQFLYMTIYNISGIQLDKKDLEQLQMHIIKGQMLLYLYMIQQPW